MSWKKKGNIEDLKGTLRGDLSRFKVIRNLPHVRIRELADEIESLMVTKDAIIKVLGDYRDGLYKDSLVQEWASFISNGYLTGKGPVKEIDIDWGPESEEAMTHALYRLSELGDIIDGAISVDEIGSLISNLTGEND